MKNYLVVSILLVSLVRQACSNSCSLLDGFNNCDCTHSESGITHIECVNTHLNNNQSVNLLQSLSDNKTEVFKTLGLLKFTGNDFAILPPNIIGNQKHISFWELTKIDLSNNKISKISGKAFHTAPELHTLILDDNDWSVSESSPRIFSSFFELKNLSLNYAFSTSDEKPTEIQMENLSDVFEGSEMYWLEELYLERNNLSYINSKVFQSLPSLMKISLKDNNIHRTKNLFNASCHEKAYFSERLIETCVLEELDLTNNKIRTIDQQFIEQLTSMSSFTALKLGGNQLLCNCDMKPFHKWLNDKAENRDKIVDVEQLKCHYPPSLKGDVLVHMHHSQLKCISVKKQSSGVSHAGTVVLSLIFTVICLAVIVLLFVNRQMVAKKGASAVMVVRDQCCPRKYSYHGVKV